MPATPLAAPGTGNPGANGPGRGAERAPATHRGAIEVRIPDGPLEAKLDLIGAMIDAIREAHRDEMSPRSWAELHKAQEAIAAALLARNEGRLLR